MVNLLNLSPGEEKSFISSPAADPYLIWGVVSKFKGYAPVQKDEPNSSEQEVESLPGKTALTVESLGGYPPMTNKLNGGPSLLELYRATDRHHVHGAVFTGFVGEDELLTMLEGECINHSLNHATCLRIEFNQARTSDGSTQSGSPNGPEIFAQSPKLGRSVIAIIDHGCPFAHPQFRKMNRDPNAWETRVKYLWDQDVSKTNLIRKDIDTDTNEFQQILERRDVGDWWYGVPEFQYGRELTDDAMNALIAKHFNSSSNQVDETSIYAEADYRALEDRSTHGTAVLDLAAGRVNPVTQREDAASEADIIFVQLPRDTISDTSGGSMTHYVLDALKYILNHCAQAQHLVINLSFGSTAGPHDGSSLLERAMDVFIAEERKAHPSRKLELFLPAGNHFLAQCHATVLASVRTQETLYWVMMADDRTDNFLELWCESGKNLQVQLESPSGKKTDWSLLNTAVRVSIESSAEAPRALSLGAIIHKQQIAIGLGQVVLLALGPTHRDSWSKVEHGTWQVHIKSAESNPFEINAWVERDDAQVAGWRQPQSFLLDHRNTPREQDDDDDPKDVLRRRGTGNSLANGLMPIVVGAQIRSSGRPPDYAAAAFSTLTQGRTSWPDWSAASDESESLGGLLVAGTRSGTLVRMNGSSVAAPQVARAYMNAWHQGKDVPDGPVTAKPSTTGVLTSPLEASRLGTRSLDSRQQMIGIRNSCV